MYVHGFSGMAIVTMFVESTGDRSSCPFHREGRHCPCDAGDGCLRTSTCEKPHVQRFQDAVEAIEDPGERKNRLCRKLCETPLMFHEMLTEKISPSGMQRHQALR